MTARGQLFVAFAVLGGALLPLAGQAEAASDKYIVMLDIEGERSPRLKKSISRMVKEQYKVMEGSSYKDAARRLRAEKLTPTNVKKVCGYLDVDGIIDGTLVKEDGRYKFTLRLRSAVTGAIAKKIPMFINQPSLSQNMADQLEERLLAAIADLPRAGGGTKIAKGKKSKFSDEEEDVEEEEEDEPKKMTKAEKRAAAKKAKAEALAAKKAEEKAAKEEAAREKKEREKAEKEMAKKKKKKGKSADEDEEDEDDADEEEAVVARGKKGKKDKKKASSKDDEDEDDEADEPVDEDSEDAEDEAEDEPKRAAMRDAGDQDEDRDDASNPDLGVAASAGRPTAATGIRTTPLLVNAGASFIGRNLTFNSSAPADQRPQGYKGKTVPGVTATGELYPMGFAGAKGVLANVGVGFVADRVIKLNSSVSDGMDGTALLPTKQSRYGANLRYRHNFGSGPKGVSVWGAVGYNRLTFSIDKSGAPENVTVDVPNMAYSYVDPGLGVRVPVAGSLSALAEGKFMAILSTGEVQNPEQYGAATVTGFDADLALEYALTDHFLVRAGGRLMAIGYKFKGNGELSDRDGNGEADVGGASDRYLGGYLTGGYAF